SLIDSSSARLLSIRVPPASPPFPYTTLFRSAPVRDTGRVGRRLAHRARLDAGTLRRERLRDAPALGIDRLRHPRAVGLEAAREVDRKSTRLNSSHVKISYAVFRLTKKKSLRM